jgi:hypothetical protein
MGWANASYVGSVVEAIGSIRSGRRMIDVAQQADDLSAEAVDALRRYSRSEFAGQEDGKALNASLMAGSDFHEKWAEDLDEAFVWSFDRDILLWRGFSSPPSDTASACFVSTSLVERQARRFKSRGGIGLAAIILSGGSRVAIPANVWSGADDRTRGVVKREAEIILPRGTSFELQDTIAPFKDRDPDNQTRLTIYKATTPELASAFSPLSR